MYLAAPSGGGAAAGKLWVKIAGGGAGGSGVTDGVTRGVRVGVTEGVRWGVIEGVIFGEYFGANERFTGVVNVVVVGGGLTIANGGCGGINAAGWL